MGRRVWETILRISKEVEGSYLTSELMGLSMHIFYNDKKTNGLQYAFVSQAGGGIGCALT